MYICIVIYYYHYATTASVKCMRCLYPGLSTRETVPGRIKTVAAIFRRGVCCQGAYIYKHLGVSFFFFFFFSPNSSTWALCSIAGDFTFHVMCVPCRSVEG